MTLASSTRSESEHPFANSRSTTSSARMVLWPACDNDNHDHQEPTRQEQPRLLTLAVEIHERVRSQVHADTWRAFWLVAVEDRTVREAAESLGKTYAATFAAQKRVRQLLREEGRKLLERSMAIGTHVEEGS